MSLAGETINRMEVTMNGNDARIREAEAHQARIVAALPAYPQYGYYVKTGLAGYGPDLDVSDYPVTGGWEDLADVISSELIEAADFAFEGASIAGDQADGWYDQGERMQALESYRDAWHAFKRSEELRVLAATFSNDRKDAPLYAGRPELWHATIYDLIGQHFPVDCYDHSRLYVWECEEAPPCEVDDCDNPAAPCECGNAHCPNHPHVYE